MGSKARSALIVVVCSCLLFLIWLLPSSSQEQRGSQSCSACHQELPSERLPDSVHQGFSCLSCHPGAEEVPHKRAIDPQTCGGCHPESAEPYWKSVHGRDLLQGIQDVPACPDCHGSHEMLPVKDPNSSVFPINLPQTCGRCHENAGISERFGLAARRYTTYIDTYHGISLRYGNLIAANCTSCHGSHLILAASDPNSSIHPSNIPETCGKCHPNAGENFLKGKVHVEANPEVSPGVYAVRLFYTLFIGGLGAFFLLHITLDLIRWLRRRHA